MEDGKRVVTDGVVLGKHVDLLMHKMGGNQHYSTIRNFSRLISVLMSSHNGAVYCCRRCLRSYSRLDLLEEHSLDCSHVRRTKFPKDPRCRCTNVQKQLPAPFVVYADFEFVLEPLSDVDTIQGVEVGTESSITPYQEHVTCSFSYKIVSSASPDFSKPIVWYRGPDAADDDRVRDHCYITGAYRGAAHSACNLNYRINTNSWKLPVVMHNLKGYDGH